MSSPLPPDPYEALNVAKDALLPAIRSAHRKLVLLTHPDKFPDESVRATKADEFHRIQQAYELLSDETRRQQYDEQVKLAKLRKERYGDRPPPQTTRVEVRTAAPPRDFDRVYRERRAPSSYVDDDVDYFSSRNERPTAGRYSYETRHTARAFDDRKAARAADERLDRDRIERDRVREVERVRMAEKKKTREKDRQRGRDEKYPRTAIYVDEDDDSDRRRPRLFREEGSRKSGDETSRRHGRSSDERLPKDAPPPRRRADDDIVYERKLSDARQHMERSDRSERSVSSQIHARPSMPQRASTTAKYAFVQPASPVVEDTVRRSHAHPRRTPERERPRTSSKTQSSSSKKDSSRDPIGIVDPPAFESRTRVMPSMPASSSSPSTIKIPSMSKGMPQPQRAATMHYANEAPPEIRSLARSSTSPMVETPTRRRDAAPVGSSKLRTATADAHVDQDYPGRRSSDRSPRNRSPAESTTYVTMEPRYTTRSRPRKVVVEEDDYDDSDDSEEDDDDSSRSPSPHSRYPSEKVRPTYGRGSSSTAKYAPSYFTSRVYPADMSSSRRPTLRAETTSSSSHRVPSSLRQEPSPLGRGTIPLGRKESSSYGRGYDVQYSPKYRAEDIAFTDELRRGSESYVY
ncbi:MAG: hypothetical protein M1837_006458 [Sclerophora amabilis]|nr:MAG: hypothetical protein M1837_006458 [Sclerophora amabilis]